jgi:hypothetical protein
VVPITVLNATGRGVQDTTSGARTGSAIVIHPDWGTLAEKRAPGPSPESETKPLVMDFMRLWRLTVRYKRR